MNASSINGWINLYKPIGLSSFGALKELKNLLHFKSLPKLGHAGTLDPFASGILPVAVGECTKLINFISDAQKEYEFDIDWRFSTDTGDLSGKVLEISKRFPDQIEIQNALDQFFRAGYIKQTPSKYSAIKINGERAYRLSRQGVDFQMHSREVLLHEVKILNHLRHQDSCITKLYVRSGRGFYIRSLAEDIGKKLELFCHVSRLLRISVGFFFLKDTITIDYIKQLLHNTHTRDGYLKNPLSPIPKQMVIEVDKISTNLLRNGQKVFYDIASNPVNNRNGNFLVIEKFCKKVIAICTLENGFLHPKRVLHL
ncbi:MAG: tRNA pseudouridine(55) synthase TruB [Proteobacteria bacterium]|nr:tRNA pseudouridine(55) synthase TruB [Pseudomonadota bacterium]